VRWFCPIPQYADRGCNYLILQDILPPRFFVGILEWNI
jgi:hypothetical protein